jgi:starch phosphorylase
MASNIAVPRERRPSTSAPISDLKGPVGPEGISRPKHKRTFTGFGAGEIKSVEGELYFMFRGSLQSHTNMVR